MLSGVWQFVGLLLSLSPAAGSAAGDDSTSARATAPAAAEKQAGTDLYGDPLPPGARGRLGTVRFRVYWSGFALSPDGKTLALSGYEGIRLSHVPSGKVLNELRGGREASPGIIGFSPDGTMLATKEEGTIRLWEVATGKQLWRVQGDEGGYAQGAFSPDSRSFVSWGGDRAVYLREAATGKVLRKHPPLPNEIPYNVTVSPNGTTL